MHTMLQKAEYIGVEGKVAIVTGAGNGIGKAIARQLAEHGAKVALLDIARDKAEEAAAEMEDLGLTVTGIACDVSLRSEVDSAVQTIKERFGTISILVNNAGVGGPFHRADQVSEEEWDWILNTNLKSVYLFCHQLLPDMKQKRYGRILNIASIQGLFGSAHSSTYVASKHGMIGYTKTIAAEWGEFGITCNAICPGYVDTALGVQTDKISDYMERVMHKSPVKRIATPDEIAALAMHILGPYGGYINGSAYTIDGGITSHVGITSNL
jgi:3-oxoacyl-[acyl-carrier protein] reductase